MDLNPLYAKTEYVRKADGKKDDYQFDYLDDNRRFADQINGALFKGRQIVKPDELQPDESQLVSTGGKAGTGDMMVRGMAQDVCMIC